MYEDMPPWAIPAAIGFGGGIIVVVLILIIRSASKGPGGPKRTRHGSLQIPCSVCQRQLVINAQDLRPLAGSEIGLAVRAIPKIAGRKLAEYDCPYCESSHCFTVDGGGPEWVGANLYTPQTRTSNCLECRKPLKRPPWPEGQFKGRPLEAPELHPDYGMICSRCGAVCCVGCVKDATRNRTKDGTFLCPRCRRSPVDAFFYP